MTGRKAAVRLRDGDGGDLVGRDRWADDDH